MNTKLYLLNEPSGLSMSYVIVTQQNNAIIVDGGQEPDMPLLKEIVGGRRVLAWILTHPHDDHIGGFKAEMLANGCQDLAPERIVYNAPTHDYVAALPNFPDSNLARMDLACLPSFDAIRPLMGERSRVVQRGDRIQLDECEIHVLHVFHEENLANLLNDMSVVFTLTTPNKKVMFLGDLGAQGGDILLDESREYLKSDLVQMAHHGHCGVGMDVYAEILPQACMWNCPDWLYEEKEIIFTTEEARAHERMRGRSRGYGVKMTRKWMDLLGVKTHYVSKDGPLCIEL